MMITFVINPQDEQETNDSEAAEVTLGDLSSSSQSDSDGDMDRVSDITAPPYSPISSEGVSQTHHLHVAVLLQMMTQVCIIYTYTMPSVLHV